MMYLPIIQTCKYVLKNLMFSFISHLVSLSYTNIFKIYKFWHMQILKSVMRHWNTLGSYNLHFIKPCLSFLHNFQLWFRSKWKWVIGLQKFLVKISCTCIVYSRLWQCCNKLNKGYLQVLEIRINWNRSRQESSGTCLFSTEPSALLPQVLAKFVRRNRHKIPQSGKTFTLTFRSYICDRILFWELKVVLLALFPLN
jgi:hypothetical protein